MSSSQTTHSFEESMQNISEFLKTRVIDPAQEEKEHLLKEAENEKQRILKQARDEASHIVEEAQKAAAQEKASLESALRIASQKAVDSLKSALETRVLSESIETPTGELLSSSDLMKESLGDVVKLLLQRDESAELLLSDTLKNQLSDYVQNEITRLGSSAITISSDTVPSGFSVILKEKKLVFDFSRDSLVELLSQYLRPELRDYLFSRQE